MKQRSGIDKLWQDDSQTPRRRWLRRLCWLGGFCAAVAVAVVSGWITDELDLLVLAGSCATPFLIWRRWRAHRAERRWRRDAILFEPPLPKPVSRIDDEHEWRWPAHPLVRVPLALLLTGLLFWALVLNQLQLPALWLVAVAVVALLTLWCWREPLLLVGMVAAGVALLALLRWLSDLLTVVGAAGVMLSLLAVGAIMIAEIRKRTEKRRTTS